jgi:hypothetical protein
MSAHRAKSLTYFIARSGRPVLPTLAGGLGLAVA